MADKIKQLRGLVDLAKETSSESRQSLLHEVTGLFMDDPEELNEQEIAFFGDIMFRLAKDMEAKVRAQLAETLAEAKAAPMNVVEDLANDEIVVAEPVLTRSSLLGDPALLAIIEKHSQEHLLAISQRSMVSDQVAGSLAEKGDDRVLGSLAGNDGAELSETTMATMIGRAVDKKNVGGRLAARTDVTNELAKRLFQNVSAAVRTSILSDEPGIAEDQVDRVIEEVGDELTQNQGEDDKDYAQRFVERKVQLNQLNLRLVETFVRNRDIWKLVAGIAALTSLDFAMVRQSMFDPSGQKIAVLCKAIDMDLKVFEDIIDFTDFKRSRTAQDKLALSGAYSGMTVDAAKRALRFLRLRKAPASGAVG